MYSVLLLFPMVKKGYKVKALVSVIKNPKTNRVKKLNIEANLFMVVFYAVSSAS